MQSTSKMMFKRRLSELHGSSPTVNLQYLNKGGKKFSFSHGNNKKKKKNGKERV